MPDSLKVLEESGDTIDNYMRAGRIKDAYVNMNSIKATLRAHPDIKLRHFVPQRVAHVGIDEMQFGNEYTWPLQ